MTEMSDDLQKQVLLFTTGSDRIPVGGVSEMVFKITRVDNVNMSVLFSLIQTVVSSTYRVAKKVKQRF